VLVLIDMRRYQQRTVSFGERARAAGMTVALITDPWRTGGRARGI
jgi:DNA-binding MurR/RpiR family transcriptional regulator